MNKIRALNVLGRCMAKYKIKDIETLTGIKAHTIRIWEKRYQLIQPNRTDTAIRSYTDEELVRLLNISLLNKKGIKISRIAEMDAHEIQSRVRALSISDSDDTIIDSLILAMIQMDELSFSKILDQLTQLHGINLAYKNHIIPFLERIGVMWIIGSINPSQEHFISNLIRQKIISEIEKLPAPAEDAPTAVLYLPEHEWHELGLLLYQYHLKNSGKKTIYLGQSLPYEALLLCVNQVKPNWVITSWLSATEEKYISSYFNRMLTDITSCGVLAGGYQIIKSKHILPKNLTVFHSMEELDSFLVY